MSTKKYLARTGNYYIRTNEEAQEVGEFIEQAFPTGVLNAEDLVRVAENPATPVHRYFEWDDAKAANAYRVSQARHILRAIVTRVNDHEIPSFHSVLIDDERSYASLDQCVNAPSLWNQVLQKALDEAEIWAERYKSYQELAPIREAIEEKKQEYRNESARS